MPLTLRIALRSLAAHKLRAVLAMLGVFLGALALTGVQHVSQAMVRQAELEAEKLGPNLFMARSGQIRFRRSGGAGVTGENVVTFTPADARALAEGLPGVLQWTPFVVRTIPVRADGVTTTCQLVGAQASYPDVRGFHPEFGRFFTALEVEDREMVVVLGRAIAERLFGRAEDAVGRQAFFFRAMVRVVGVMEAKGADITGANQDEQVFTPITTYMRRLANQDWITGVYVQLAPDADPEAAKEAGAALLRSRRPAAPGQRDDFSVITARDTIRLQRQALDLVGTLGLISSSVSFAVGGLGILSIMILMVRMRRLEIGVRRAIGARRRDIVRQFLLEAGLMSAAGGSLGVLAALALLTVVYSLAGFPWVFDPLLIALAPLGSALLGVASGAYPAWQASRVEILDVLRGHE